MATTTFPTRDDFAALLNESLGGENETFEGKVVKGTVTGIENDMAVIDVGLKSEGRVALREFAAQARGLSSRSATKSRSTLTALRTAPVKRCCRAIARAVKPRGTSSRRSSRPAIASRA